MSSHKVKSGSQGKQASISHFFANDSTKSASGKRARSPVDLTISSDEEPPTKRTKPSQGSTGTNPYSSIPSKPESPMKKKYRFISLDEEPLPKRLVVNPKAKEKQDIRRKELKETLKQTYGREDAGSSSPQSPADETIELSDDSRDETGSDHDARNLSSKFSSTLAVRMQSSSGKGRKKDKVLGPSGQPYTPLELQVKQLKEDNLGTLLLFEVGYKYRFFGEDARIASKALGIACFMDRNFLTASIPLHRKTIHVKKLLSLGYRVGIAGQTETAALKKAGSNKSGPFTREITELYTATTFVEDMDSVDDSDVLSTVGAALLCISESLAGGMGADDRVNIGMVSVSPATGEVIYDIFTDGAMRTELETRLAHIKPYELLLPRDLSSHTERMLKYYGENRHARIEILKDNLSHSDAFDYLQAFYDNDIASQQSTSTTEAHRPIASIVALPRPVVVALAHGVRHLTAYGLSGAFKKTAFFSRFLERSHMLLNANTLANLEVFENQSDFTRKGTLISLIDRTLTQFGSRQLRQWVGKPLIDKVALQERFQAVDEIHNGRSENLVKLTTLLKGLPDLVRGLSRIQYGKSNPKEVASVLSALSRVGNTFSLFEKPDDVGFQSRLLNDIIFALPRIQVPIRALLEELDLKYAKEGAMADLWKNPNKYPKIKDTKDAILSVDMYMKEHLKEVRKLLHRPTLDYVTVSDIDYLIEVPKADQGKVPDNWNRISGTKKVTRFHTPEARKQIFQRDQFKETLATVAKEAFLAFQAEINGKYEVLRDAINKLAIADALISIARVATIGDYAKPIITEDGEVNIVQGRHPVIETLSSSPFVRNNINLGTGGSSTIVITGPNMGGKSSCVKLIALIVIMAQIGCYVPADFAKISLHDAVLTRMGAFDELSRGRSTFMVEMSETAEILSSATEKSLVILDELGRGTSTYDGIAIASAVLEHSVAKIKCKTLFITHYPQIGIELSQRFPNTVVNMHMGYVEETLADGRREIHFLYKLTKGIADRSFGVECGQLAGLPQSVLDIAATKSKALDEREHQRRFALLLRTLASSLNTEDTRKLREAKRMVRDIMKGTIHR